MGYEALIRRFDRPTSFFYVDPPYYGYEDYYGRGLFGKPDFEVLRDVLRGIKGRFIMSINDAPEIRELFRGLPIEEVQTTYLAAGGDRKKKVKELLISNFKPPKK